MTKRKGQNCSNTSVLWTTEHQKILEELIDLLISPPIMAYPKFNEPYVLHIDVCQNGLGAILYQRQSTEKLGMIAYGSRTLTPTRKELLYALWQARVFSVEVECD